MKKIRRKEQGKQYNTILEIFPASNLFLIHSLIPEVTTNSLVSTSKGKQKIDAICLGHSSKILLWSGDLS